jgi:hypothetical protein
MNEKQIDVFRTHNEFIAKHCKDDPLLAYLLGRDDVKLEEMWKRQKELNRELKRIEILNGGEIRNE